MFSAQMMLYELSTMLLPVPSPAAVTYYVHYNMPSFVFVISLLICFGFGDVSITR